MNRPVSIFLYEDDQVYADEVKHHLEVQAQARKISLSIHPYKFARQALNAIERWGDRRLPDLALLDMHQPDRTEAGLDICKEIRDRWPDVPVFFMSNNATRTGDHRRAYEAGATNFFNKDDIDGPEGKEELLSAILSQLGLIDVVRKGDGGFVQSGSLRIAMEPPSVYWHGKAISLNPKQRSILYELARNEGSVCRNEKLAKIGGWIGDSKENYYANLRQCVTEIREKIGDTAWRPEKGKRYGLIAVPKQGYQWIPDPQKSS